MSIDALEKPAPAEVAREKMEVDIACVGFGPAMGGFLTTLTRAWTENPGDPAFESKVTPGIPLQVLCYERADDIASGVSGVVTHARGIRTSFPDLNIAEIPMSTEIKSERVMYLLDPVGASHRSFALRLGDRILRAAAGLLKIEDHAFELPWTPPFLHKNGGLILSVGQFNQWVGSQLMNSGFAQVWPGMPVAEPLFADHAVVGVRLADQGVDKDGVPSDDYMPGIDVHAKLTVVGDGPFGPIGRAIDQKFGIPKGHEKREWALGMKFVIELPSSPDDSSSPLQPGTVWHTFGFPEPEIFGFLYVHPDRLVSVGIFVPSWMSDPSRTAYRYLQHYIQHPALWKHLKYGILRSWGAKSLDESGRHGEPFLNGNGYARIGEGSGSTNMLAGSGVDEAWTTGTQLAESVIELLKAGKPFTKEFLSATYEAKRRESWVERGAREAENARNGFHGGVIQGMIGMALAGLSRGKISVNAKIPPTHKQIHRARSEDLKRKHAAELAILDGRPLHDALMTLRGWPEIAFDGRLLISHQDALLMGGKVQAMPGFADHVVFRNIGLCISCEDRTCIAMCSGQAITLGPEGLPDFEREKCVHCGACLWNCSKEVDNDLTNIEFRAGSGGLHSAEN